MAVAVMLSGAPSCFGAATRRARPGVARTLEPSANAAVREEAAFDELYNIRLHPAHGARSRVPRVPALRCIVTPRGAGEPKRYTDGA